MGHKHGRRLIVLGQQEMAAAISCADILLKRVFFQFVEKELHLLHFTSSMMQQEGVFQYFEGQLKLNEL